MSWITERQASSSGSSKSILVGGAIALSLAGCADAYIAAPSIHPLRHSALSSSSLGRAPRRSPAAGVSLLRSASQRPLSAGDDTDGSDLLAPIWSASSKIPAKIAGAAAVFSLFLGGSVSVPPEAHAAPSGEPIQIQNSQIKEGSNKLLVKELDPAVKDKVQVFAEILNDINSAYVDPLDLDKITETGFNAMLQSLDPYTEFENPKATNQMRTLTTGNYGGVGLAISKLRDPKDKEEPYIYVMNAFEGYAFDAGVRVGDKILKVDGKDVKDIPVADASELLKGQQGTEVKVTLERNGKVMDKVLNRRQVPLRDVPLAMSVDDKNEIGYVKLSGFSSYAPFELRFALGRLNQMHPLKSVILDLRGNTGGLLSSAIQIADIFLPPDVNVVSTKGRVVETATGTDANSVGVTPAKEVQYKSKMIPKYGGSNPDGSPKFLNEPLLDPNVKVVVLTDKMTASASEIVSGAIQDHDRGILVGETTYGKGLVQVLQRLSGGRQLKFTTAKYYTPSGRCIQSKTYKADGKSGTTESKVTDKDRQTFFTDAGRPVRDGGGVEPDVLVPPRKPGQLETFLGRWDAFYRYAGQVAPTLKNGEELATLSAPIVTDEVYDKFQKWAMSQVDTEALTVGGPFAKSLELFTDAIKEAGFDDAVGDIKMVQKHLNDLMISEFKTQKEPLKKKLESQIRSRFVVESRVLASGVDSDPAIIKAVELLDNNVLFADTLTKGAKSTLAQAPAPKASGAGSAPVVNPKK